VQQKPRVILIIINPYCGEKRSRSILFHQIMPILNRAYIRYDVRGKAISIFFRKFNITSYRE
jgi:hypothetical protein